MPAITIFIPFLMALSMPYRSRDSDDIKYSTNQLDYLGTTSTGPVQFIHIYCADTQTGSQNYFYAELMSSFTEDSNGTFSGEVKIFRRDSSQSREYFTVNLDTNTVEMTQDKTNASSFLIKSSNNSVHSSGSRFQLEYLNTDDDSETQPLFGRQPHARVPRDCTPYQFYIHNNKSTETRNNGYHVIGLTEPLQC